MKQLFFFLGSVFLLSSSLIWAQGITPTPEEDDVITYKYYYGSILALDPSIPLDERRNWYFTFDQEVDSCQKRFVYPEDFDASVDKARQTFRDNCYYQTILEINNFENNLYFQKRRPEYDVYRDNAPFAEILEDTLSCEDCSLYPNRNSDIDYLDSSVLDDKIRVFKMNDTQREIFSHIFNRTNDKIRMVETPKSTIRKWAKKINAAKNRTELKLVMDDFVNHIHFAPIETKEELIHLGQEIDHQQKTKEPVTELDHPQKVKKLSGDIGKEIDNQQKTKEIVDKSSEKD